MGEAGVHIEGVTFVVDAMYGMQPVMDPFTGLEVSEMVPISQAVRPRVGSGDHSAMCFTCGFSVPASLYPSCHLTSWLPFQAAVQRGACAGWLRDGHCFRLCTEEAFQQLPQQTVGVADCLLPLLLSRTIMLTHTQRHLQSLMRTTCLQYTAVALVTITPDAAHTLQKGDLKMWWC